MSICIKVADLWDYIEDSPLGRCVGVHVIIIIFFIL